MKSDIEIARECRLKPIEDIARQVQIPVDELEHYGKYIAKVPESLIDEKKVENSNLILVTAITPTKAGIGKTTVSVGLALGLKPHWEKEHRGFERTFSRSVFRFERRCGWRRLCPDITDGQNQLAFYGGFPCRYFGS